MRARLAFYATLRQMTMLAMLSWLALAHFHETFSVNQAQLARLDTK